MVDLSEYSVEIHQAIFDRIIADLNTLADRYDLSVGLLLEESKDLEYLKTPKGKLDLANSFDEIVLLCEKVSLEIESVILAAHFMHGAISGLEQYDRVFYGTDMANNEFIDVCDEFKALVDEFAIGYTTNKIKVDSVLGLIPDFVSPA